MSHGLTSFPTKGCCIYCGRINVHLSKEHVVPYSLGGQHVIQAASCKQCADVTKKFEQHVARDMWGDARISADAPTRRKKERPTHLRGGHPQGLKIPYSEYPASFVFYQMPTPGIIQGISPNIDLSIIWKLIVVGDSQRYTEFEKKYGTSLKMQFRHTPDSFGRMIAKIGYCHILTQLDASEFEPLIVPYILGTKSNVSYLVGCIGDMLAPENDIGYKLSTEIRGNPHAAYIIANIRLLANCSTPTYSVVVGQTSSFRNTERVIKKLGVGEMSVTVNLPT